MKKVLLGLLLFTSFFCSSAQSLSGDTLPEYSFSKMQRAEWDSLEMIWMKKKFNPFLKKNKIKITCASCDAVYIEVYAEVGSDGQCKATLLKGRKCASEFTKAQKDEMERSLMQLAFPASFYNTSLLLRLGRHLKC